MSRLSTLIWLVVIVASALLLYMVKYEVQSLRAQIAKASRELAEEKEGLHVAAAEWAYLNRPQRLESLAAKYLSSTSMTADQIAEIEAIRFPEQKTAADPEEGLPASPVSFQGERGGAR